MGIAIVTCNCKLQNQRAEDRDPAFPWETVPCQRKPYCPLRHGGISSGVDRKDLERSISHMERNFPAAKRQYGLGYRKGDRRDSQAEPLAKGPPWGTFSQGAVPISAVGKADALPKPRMNFRCMKLPGGLWSSQLVTFPNRENRKHVTE